MSTRSAIIQKVAEGVYRGVYCHFDGYLSHQGPILLKYYMKPLKVAQLIDMGQIRSIGELGVAEPFDAIGIDIKYGRTSDEVASQIGHNGHVYVFEDGEWKYNGVKINDVPQR